jgi:hypothetical protein
MNPTEAKGPPDSSSLSCDQSDEEDVAQGQLMHCKKNKSYDRSNLC